MRYALLLSVSMLVGGCFTPTTIEKSVTVEKDPSGQVIKRIEIESVTQELGARTLKLEYIKVEEPKTFVETPASDRK